METFELEPRVLTGHRGVSFSVARGNSIIECVISCKALQEYFWVEPNADDQRIISAFRNGYGRIRAIAERKALARPDKRLEITVADFYRR